MTREHIEFEHADGVAVITLSRPNVLNALSMPLMAEVDAALTECESDDDVRAIVVTGAGDKAFSAGADIHGTHHGISLARRGGSLTTWGGRRPTTPSTSPLP